MAHGTSKRTRRQPAPDIPPDRPGLPDPESIQSVETFVSPENEEYKILHTSELDAYDEPPKPRKARRPRKNA